ncbi:MULTISPECIES: hypothetical protein [unclassified Endozoicomonas]|uniref:hypothetical protein n=1 Tax=unclassified Endozoicomonas TaxID=2644528 RepID=UPI0021498EF2|nr:MULTISPECIES: hypothetical protein [unclassified Endozoicomonas]
MKHHYSAPFKSRKTTIRTQGRAINAIAYPKNLKPLMKNTSQLPNSKPEGNECFELGYN